MEKLKIGIAGLGRIGKIHLENLLQIDSVEVIAAMDPSLEALKYAKFRGVKDAYEKFDDLIKTNNLQAIIICTPTNTHAHYVEIAAKNKIHVFCEKPLDLNINRIIEVLEVVKKSNIKLMIGFNRRFDNEFQKVRNSVINGKVGDPFLVKITSRDPAPPPLKYIKTSGGIFLDMTIHDFDMARFVVGKEIEEVYAKGSAFFNKSIEEFGDIDTAVTILKYIDSSIAVIDNCRKAVYGYDQRIEVFGSRGMIQGNNLLNDNTILYDKKGISSSLPLNFFLERYSEAYKIEIHDFVDSVINNKPVSVSGEDGLKSLQIGLAAKKSLLENRPVKISEIKI